MITIRRYFINGLLILLPGVITVYVLVFSLVMIDGILGGIIAKLVGFHVPGAGSILTILLILATGIVTTNVIGRKVFQWAENVFLKIPVLNTIYQGVKQVVKAFSSSTEVQEFQRVVLVEYPQTGIHAIGFVTNDNIPEFNAVLKEATTTVFIPTTPNPTSGVCVVVPTKDCIHLDLTVEDAFKTIISAGIVSPNKKSGAPH